MSSKKKILSIQALRAFACIIIYLYHATHYLPVAYMGISAVSLFLMLSGFVMTLAYWNRPVDTNIKSAVSFSVKKIYPLFWLHVFMLFLGLVREILTTHQSILSYIYKLAITIPLLQSLSPYGYQAFNSVDWYLSTTMILYCIFPFILRYLKKKQRSTSRLLILIMGIFMVMLVIKWLVGRYLPDYARWLLKDFPFYRLGDFFIGCILGTIFINRKEQEKAQSRSYLVSTLWEIAAVLSVLVTVYCALTYLIDYKWALYGCLFIPSSAFLLYCFACEGGLISRIIVNPVTMYISKISAVFYLVHRLILLYTELGIKHIFHIELNGWILAAVTLPITILFIELYLRLTNHLAKRNEEKARA